VYRAYIPFNKLSTSF